MVKHNHANAPLTGTWTGKECDFLPDQKPKKNSNEIIVALSKREVEIILIIIENFFKGVDGAIMAIKHYELVEEFEKIENKIKDALNGE